MHAIRSLAIAFVMLSMCGQVLWAQPRHVTIRPPASNVIVPQSRPYGLRPEGQRPVQVTRVEALIDILQTTATTTIELNLENTSPSRQEAELVVPVPDGAVVRGFAYDGPSGEITAEVLPRDKARQIYRDLVSRIRDPALVEFAGYNLIRSSVFPIEAHGRQKVRLTYEHLLEADGQRIDYGLPRSESVDYDLPWTVTCHIRAKRPITSVYSPSHEVFTNRKDATEVTVKVEAQAGKEPGPFRLSYLIADDGPTASLLAYPDPEVGGGYFLLLAGLSPERSRGETQLREVTIVLDRSGSMHDRKIRQVKEAALQVIAGLKQGEAFNVILYNDQVEQFSLSPVIKDADTQEAARKYIDGITATGGTNLHEALKVALAQEPSQGRLPIVLFLTDGLPTVGQTSEVAIRDLVSLSNPHKRRIFTFGVGLDVNAPLLQRLADLSRARAEFVLPDQDVEAAVGKVFKALAGPALADLRLRALGHDGRPALGRVRDVLPAVLPDLFEGDQVVVMGQYVGQDALGFELTGTSQGKAKTFNWTFTLDKADKRNGFVPRLWASRKIADLIDLVRQMGAEPGASASDPKVKELTDQIVKLSTQFGILTEYTAFLAREGTDLRDHVRIMQEATGNLSSRAMLTRSGAGGVSQGMNLARQKSQGVLNYNNYYVNDRMEQVRINAVQQTNDMAFYNRNSRWVDSRVAASSDPVTPDRTIEFGTQPFWDLVDRMAKEGRQASLSFSLDVLLKIDGQTVLVKMPGVQRP